MAKWWRRWRSSYLATLLARCKWRNDGIRPGINHLQRRQPSPNTLPSGGGDPAIPRSGRSEPGR
ncbi:hypothetical protein T05_9896 [Trichinella murrelli]|uniref:Uncharacterized protein n=1 Tax=Trichinella murrelli TaxID=144512 RepID=A0A0V0TC99_9BILA|nr:hypothetical protein T05_9896 [Trichinella murrelli]